MKNISGKTLVEVVVGVILGGIIISAGGGFKYAQAQFTPPVPSSSFNPAIPGVIGGTTPAQAQFTGLSGTQTNDNACVGCIGEYQAITVTSGFSVPLATGTASTMSQVFITAGDWDVTGVAVFTGAAATLVKELDATISTTSGVACCTQGQTTVNSLGTTGVAVFAENNVHQQAPIVRISTASTIPVYMVCQSVFSTGTLGCFGSIRARRVR